MRVTGTSALRTAVRAVAAVTALGAGLPVVPAHASPGRAPWHVSIKADATGTVGKKVHLTGKVAASAAGRLVTLQEKAGAGKPWRNQRNALVHADGTYRTYDVPTVNQPRRYRVVMPATRWIRSYTSCICALEPMRRSQETGVSARVCPIYKRHAGRRSPRILDGIDYGSPGVRFRTEADQPGGVAGPDRHDGSRTARSRRRARFSPASASAGRTSLITPRSGPRLRWQGPVRDHQLLSPLTNLCKTIPQQRRCPRAPT